MMSRFYTSFVLVWLFFFVWACAETEDERSPEVIVEHCQSDSDCFAFEICEKNSCIHNGPDNIEPSTSKDIVFEVISRDAENSESSSIWRSDPVTLLGEEPRYVVSVPPTKRVKGSISWEGQNVPSRINFTNFSPNAVNLQSTDIGQGFSVLLHENTPYVAKIEPIGQIIYQGVPEEYQGLPALRIFPPMKQVLSENEIQESPGSVLNYDWSYSHDIFASCTQEQLYNCNLRGRVFSLDDEGNEIPQVGVQVWASEPFSSEKLSSIALTDENGDYSIRISPDAVLIDYYINVGPGPEQESFPQVTFHDLNFYHQTKQVTLGLQIPDYNFVRFVGILEGDGQYPIQDAIVVFKSIYLDIGDSVGSYEVTTRLGSQIEEAGSLEDSGFFVFETELLPGHYEVTVIPSRDSGYDILQKELTVYTIDERESFDLKLTLVRQARFVGQALGPEGNPLLDTEIRAIPVRDSAEETPFHRLGSTLTNEDGNFSLYLDSGTYDLVLSPNADSGLPRLNIYGSDLGRVTNDRNFTIQFSEPQFIFGELISDFSDQWSEVEVRVYELVDVDGVASRYVLLGEAQTDEMGKFEISYSPNTQWIRPRN
jgi:hypothetical protein